MNPQQKSRIGPSRYTWIHIGPPEDVSRPAEVDPALAAVLGLGQLSEEPEPQEPEPSSGSEELFPEDGGILAGR